MVSAYGAQSMCNLSIYLILDINTEQLQAFQSPQWAIQFALVEGNKERCLS